jgi:hypothetical protein
MPDGTMLTKSDAGGYAGMSDSGDDDKSGYSDAFKRAAVKFGAARYLYRDGVPAFIQERAPSTVQTAAPAANGRIPPPNSTNVPRTGRALFAWTKDQEQRYDVGLLKYLNNWAKLQEFPGRMVEWDAEQVGLAYAEACRKLHALEASHAEAYEEALSN